MIPLREKWFSTLGCQFSCCFRWSLSSSNFRLCLLETQVSGYLTKQSSSMLDLFFPYCGKPFFSLLNSNTTVPMADADALCRS